MGEVGSCSHGIDPISTGFSFEVAIAFGTIPDAKVVRGSALNPDTKIDLINNGNLVHRKKFYIFTQLRCSRLPTKGSC